MLRSQHFTAVEVLRNQLDELQIPYKKLENPSHVTAVELKSAKLADDVMKMMDNRGFYVQCKFNAKLCMLIIYRMRLLR